MPLNKSKGNMYNWISNTHSHMGGECPHKCSYCYVGTSRFGRAPRYTGDLCLIEEEFKVNYGEGKSIFVEHCNDLFAKEVPDEFIRRILAHCGTWPKNKYIFQTKNPTRMEKYTHRFPPDVLLGTTIESNIEHTAMGHAPSPGQRIFSITELATAYDCFITVEPILDFDVDILVSWLCKSHVDFVNIGADSKGNNLPEPSVDKVKALVKALNDSKIDIREKHNLGRLLGTTT